LDAPCPSFSSAFDIRALIDEPSPDRGSRRCREGGDEPGLPAYFLVVILQCFSSKMEKVLGLVGVGVPAAVEVGCREGFRGEEGGVTEAVVAENSIQESPEGCTAERAAADVQGSACGEGKLGGGGEGAACVFGVDNLQAGFQGHGEEHWIEG